jgi:hypothetical protein
MCSLCGALGRGPSWEQGGDLGANGRWQLRREAMETAAAVSGLLAQRRIMVKANPDHGFVVSFPTGGTEIAQSLGEIWHLLMRRRIPLPDPLAGL